MLSKQCGITLPGALDVKALQSTKMGGEQDPTFTPIQENRCHGGLVEHTSDGHRRSLLGDNLGEVPPNPSRANQMPTRHGNITSVVRNDAPQVLKELYLFERHPIRREPFLQRGCPTDASNVLVPAGPHVPACLSGLVAWCAGPCRLNPAQASREPVVPNHPQAVGRVPKSKVPAKVTA